MQLIQLFIFILYSMISPNFAYAESGSVSPYILYISPQGSDFATGHSPTMDSEGINGPFATLNRAQHELRQQRKYAGLPNGATVYLRKGTYELASTFLLEANDSGSPEAPVIFQAYQNEKAILSGGRKLSNCNIEKPELLTCNTSSLNLNTLTPIGLDKRLLAAPLPPFEVFMDDKRLQLSRWPNSDRSAPGGDIWAYISSTAKGSHTEFEYHGNKLGFSKLSKNAVIHIWPANDWFDEYIGVSYTAPNKLTLTSPTTYAIQAGRRFSILNEPDTLDAPGEWIYIANEQKLSIIFKPSIKDINPVVSYLDNIIEIRNAKNIKFKDITFEYSRKTAVKISGGSSNTLENCIIRNVGGYGLKVNKGSHHNIRQSDIFDTGYGGIILHGGDRKTLTSSHHIAVNNNIHHTGRLLHVGNAALRLSGVGNTGTRNHIHHTPGMAVSIIGNNHLIEFSDIHNACEESSDCGAIYTGRDWTFHGNKIQYNRVHDVYGYGMSRIDKESGTVEYNTPHGARGIYLDDAASGFDIIGNIFYRIPDKMLQIGGGRDNTVDNNIFITNGYAIWIDARWPSFPWKKIMETRLNAVPFKSSAWKKQFPRLAKPMKNPHWPENNQITRNIMIGKIPVKDIIVPFRYIIPKKTIKIDNNIVYNHGKEVKVEYRFLDSTDSGVIDWRLWKKTGLDKSSLLADPLFNDITRGDVNLNPASPAMKLGVLSLPLSKMIIDNDALTNILNTTLKPSSYKFKINNGIKK